MGRKRFRGGGYGDQPSSYGRSTWYGSDGGGSGYQPFGGSSSSFSNQWGPLHGGSSWSSSQFGNGSQQYGRNSYWSSGGSGDFGSQWSRSPQPSWRSSGGYRNEKSSDKYPTPQRRKGPHNPRGSRTYMEIRTVLDKAPVGTLRQNWHIRNKGRKNKRKRDPDYVPDKYLRDGEPSPKKLRKMRERSLDRASSFNSQAIEAQSERDMGPSGLVKRAAYLFLQSLFQQDTFQLMRNVDKCGVFSRLLFRFLDKSTGQYRGYFFKLIEHSTKKKSVDIKDLVTLTKDFHLLDLFYSYHNLIQQVTDREDISCALDSLMVIAFSNKKIDDSDWLCSTQHDMLMQPRTEQTFSFNMNAKAEIMAHPEAHQKYVDALKECLQELKEGNIIASKDKLNGFNEYLMYKELQTLYNKEPVDTEEVKKSVEKQLEILEDDSKWEKFFQNFRLYMGQSERQVDRLIRGEILRLLDTSVATADKIFKQLIISMTAWLNNTSDNKFSIMDAGTIWKEVLKKCGPEAFSSLRHAKFGKMSWLQFKKDQLEEIKSAVEGNQVIHIVAPEGKVIEVTAVKVQQALQGKNYVLVDDDFFKSDNARVWAAWMGCTILVLMVNDENGDFWDYSIGTEYLSSNSDKKLVVISHESKKTEEFRTTYTDKCKKIEDKPEVSQLSEYSQPPEFSITSGTEDHGLPLIDVIKMDSETKAASRKEFFENLLSGQEYAYGDTVAKIENYKTQTLCRFDHLWKTVFEEEGCIFALTGNRPQLTGFISREKFKQSIVSRMKITKNGYEDFIDLCKDNDIVHWVLRNKEGRLIWLESKGGITNLKKYLTREAPPHLFALRGDYSVRTDVCLAKEPHGRLLVVLGEAGVGKSTLMQHLANQMKKVIPPMWVIPIKLANHVDYLNSEEASAVGLLEKSGNIQTQFQKKIFEFGINKQKKVTVLLDGFDELDSSLQDKVIGLIKDMLKQTNVRKLWMTSKLEMKEKLENDLSTVAMTLLPISEKDHNDYVSKLLKANELVEEPYTAKQLEDLQFCQEEIEVVYCGRFCKATLLHEACRRGYIELVQKLLEHPTANVEVKDSLFQETPLMWAARAGQLEIMKLLIEKDAKITNAKDGYTPLHLAVVSGNVEVVNYLLEMSQVHADTTDKLGRTALMWAIQEGKLDIVEILIKKDTQKVQKRGDKSSLLHIAVESGKLDIVKYLLSHEEMSELLSSQNSLKQTPLIKAARFGKLEIVIELVEGGADVDALDNDQKTALHHAADSGHDKVVEYLIEKDAAVDLQDRMGRTPAFYAAWKNHPTTLMYLVQRGASTSTPDRKGNTILHHAAEFGMVQVFEFLENSGLSSTVCGWKASTKKWWNTPLDIAAREGHLGIVQCLLRQGLDANHRDRELDTPLHGASGEGHVEVVKFLLDNHARIDVRNKSQQTPLHYAAMRDHAEIVKLLWEYGADLNVRDNRNQTPLQLAKQLKSVNVVRCLQ